MSFGKNPYVAKAEAAELKASEARDEDSRRRAYREAAHEWDRAAAREKPGKRRDEYLRHAEHDRALADAESAPESESAPAPSAPRAPIDPDRLN